MKIRSFVSFLSIFLATACVWDELPVRKTLINCNAVNLSVEVLEKTDASVCGAGDGRFEIKASGGESPYTFSLNGGDEQPSGIFNDLASGIYSITAFDKNRCSVTLERILITVEQFSVDFDQEPNTGCLDHNGVIDIVVNEPNGPYEFQLDSGEFFTSIHLENVKDGDHYITIRNDAGCNVTRLVTVERGTTSVSWQNDILPIMTASCAVTGCHNGVHLPRDWRVYDQVKQNASTIRKRTQDKSMPAEGSLTEDEIALIACWIDDGAPEN